MKADDRIKINFLLSIAKTKLILERNNLTTVFNLFFYFFMGRKFEKNVIFSRNESCEFSLIGFIDCLNFYNILKWVFH